MGGIPIPHFAAANMEAMKSAMSQSNPALTKNASEPTVSSKISNIYKKGPRYFWYYYCRCEIPKINYHFNYISSHDLRNKKTR